MKLNRNMFKPVLLTIGIYLFSYLFPKVAVNSNNLHYLSIPLDDKIPIISCFIIIYFLSYAQWAIMFYYLLKEKREHKALRICNALILGSLIGMTIFMIFPTAIQRPKLVSHNIFDEMIKQLYFIDNPINALPSFHCFMSTMTVITLLTLVPEKKTVVWANIIFTILVFCSTVLTKQHYILDIPAGILLAIISFAITKEKDA